MELKNQTILITGGTSGIGLVLARKLNNAGNKVIILGRNNNKLRELINEGFYTIECDLTKLEAIESAAIKIQNEFPDLTMLFNNAGVQYNYLFTDTVIPLEKIAAEITVNVTGQLLLTQLLLPVLSTAAKAWIINTTSGLGAFPKTDGLVYSATKAAMRNFTIGLQLALKNSAVKVLEFIPPVTETEMTKSRQESKMSAEELVDRILPQLEKERSILTVPKMRLFLWIAFLFPELANKILS